MKAFEEIQLSDHSFSRVERGVRKIWDVPVLVHYAKEQKYKTFDLPIDGINMSGLFWKLDSMVDFAYHMHRVNTTDLKYPVLLDDQGCICDGWHRLVKAVLLKKKYIKAVRLDEMPEPSCTENV